MPARRPEIRTAEDALARLAERVRRLEDTAAERVIPPGYVVSFNATNDIVITRVSDGATNILVFS